MTIFYLYILCLNPPSTSYITFYILHLSVLRVTSKNAYEVKLSAHSAQASNLCGDQQSDIKIHSDIFPHCLNHTNIYQLPYIPICPDICLSLTEFLNARNYFVSPAMFSKLFKHRCIIFLHSFMMTRWANTRITATKQQLVSSKQDQTFHKVWHTTTANFAHIQPQGSAQAKMWPTPKLWQTTFLSSITLVS